MVVVLPAFIDAWVGTVAWWLLGFLFVDFAYDCVASLLVEWFCLQTWDFVYLHVWYNDNVIYDWLWYVVLLVILFSSLFILLSIWSIILLWCRFLFTFLFFKGWNCDLLIHAHHFAPHATHTPWILSKKITNSSLFFLTKLSFHNSLLNTGY